MPGVVLRTDLTEKPVAWKPVLFVPFGPAEDQLGFQSFPESTSSQPDSFAVAPDGSIWIVDRWKNRLVHYSRSGRYLGSVSVASPERPEDVVFVADTMYVLRSPSRGIVSTILPGGRVQDTVVNDKGKPLWINYIFPGPDGLIASIGGYSEPGSLGPVGGQIGYARVAIPGDGQIARLPGLPLAGGVFVNLEQDQSQDGAENWEVRYDGPSGSVIQPIEFRVVATSGGRTRRVLGAVGPGNLVPMGADVAMYALARAAHSPDIERYGGSRWVLRLGRSPVVWERVPNPGIPDDPQRRRITPGPGGTLYLMVAEKGGMRILERP